MITLPPSPGIHLSLSLSKLHPLKINQTQFSASTPTYISIILKLKKILTKPCECVWPPGGRLQSSCRATNISASPCLEEIQNTCVPRFLQQAVKSLFLSKHLVPMHVFSSVMFARAVKDLRLLRNPPDRQNSVMILSLGLLQPKPATAAGPASLNSGTRR